jgi:hypothetical protein
MALTLSNGRAFQSENTGKDVNCGQCHTMTIGEAGNILHQLDPAMSVSNVMESPVNGLWEVLFENNGKKGVLYIPYSKKHIIAGMVVEIATGIVDVRSLKQGVE